MNEEELNECSQLLPIQSQRWIAVNLHVGRNRVRTVSEAEHESRKLTYRLGPPVKATLEIKNLIIEATRDDSRLSDFQFVSMVHDRFQVCICHFTVNHLHHLPKLYYLSPRRCQALTPD
jgi:hypothetical protein